MAPFNIVSFLNQCIRALFLISRIFDKHKEKPLPISSQLSLGIFSITPLYTYGEL